jgi:excinuclease ABC subunit C
MIGKEQIARFPAAPGVYLMKGGDGGILYVGKARDLKKRVRSYFGAAPDSRWHIRFLMERVADIDYIVTDTEKEALILENALIKKHRPRYNFNLRDDKTYFSLRMDMNEEFPRLTVIRKVTRDGARYFGPYSSAAAAREVLKELNKLFPLRHYPLETCRRRRRPCLFFQMKQCAAPCHGMISRDDYAALANGAALFLEGKNFDLLRLYQQRMARAAAEQRYEEAGRCRDLIRAIEQTVEKQKIVTQGGDADILGYARAGERLEIVLLFMRGGTISGSRSFSALWEMDDAEGAASFLHEYYSRDLYVPEEILVPLPLPEPEAFAEMLTEKRGKKVAIAAPQRGVKRELVELAMRNALTSLEEKSSADAGREATLEELRQRLHLTRLPRTIECYDISNIQGEQAVGSRIVFRSGLPDKAGYRRYRIRTVAQADDFAMMREVFSRRLDPDRDSDDLPDLILVDGGIGQLNILCGVLAELGVTGIDAASLAKSRVEKGMTATAVRRSDERVFLPGRKNPVVLRQNSSPLLLLARIRDEAHRFAITYHKNLRGKAALTSSLDAVPGIGPQRKRTLLRHFGSLKKVREASLEELRSVPGIAAEVGETVWRHLHGEDAGQA